MNGRWAVVCAVCVSLAAWAQNTNDGVVTASAALPASGTVRLRAGVLASGTELTANSAVLWSLGANLGLGADVQWRPGQLSAGAELRWNALRQAETGMDLTASARVRTLGHEGTGAALDARLAVGRSVGPLDVVANAAVSKGFAGREDVDLEGSASATWRLPLGFRAGATARAHGELVDELKTAEDEGRPVGFLAGPTLAFRHERFEVQALAAWNSPRGSVTPGMMGGAFVSLDL